MVEICHHHAASVLKRKACTQRRRRSHQHSLHVGTQRLGKFLPSHCSHGALGESCKARTMQRPARGHTVSHENQGQGLEVLIFADDVVADRVDHQPQELVVLDCVRKQRRLEESDAAHCCAGSEPEFLPGDTHTSFSRTEVTM